MKKFRFGLQSFLRYKEYLEHIAQVETAKALTKVTACEKNIERSEKEHYITATRLEKETATGIDVKRFRLYTSYLEGIEIFLKYENMRRKELLKELAIKQKELTEKTVERKSIENLKERKKEEYYDNLRKNEQKETDDIILLRKAGSISR